MARQRLQVSPLQMCLTLRPEGAASDTILMQITDANGVVEFEARRDGFAVPGSYLMQVQDANLNNVDGLYPTPITRGIRPWTLLSSMTRSMSAWEIISGQMKT